LCLRSYCKRTDDRGAVFISITEHTAGRRSVRKARLPKNFFADPADKFWAVAEYAADCHIRGALSLDFLMFHRGNLKGQGCFAYACIHGFFHVRKNTVQILPAFFRIRLHVPDKPKEGLFIRLPKTVMNRSSKIL